MNSIEKPNLSAQQQPQDQWVTITLQRVYKALCPNVPFANMIQQMQGVGVEGDYKSLWEQEIVTSKRDKILKGKPASSITRALELRMLISTPAPFPTNHVHTLRHR